MRNAPKRKNGSRKKNASPSSSSTRIGLYGSFKAASKDIDAMDCGLVVDDVLWVKAADFQFTSDSPVVIQMTIPDFGVSGSQHTVRGPLSRTILLTPGVTQSLHFSNPNPRFMWRIAEKDDQLLTIHCSADSATVTFSGDLLVDRPASMMRKVT